MSKVKKMKTETIRVRLRMDVKNAVAQECAEKKMKELFYVKYLLIQGLYNHKDKDLIKNIQESLYRDKECEYVEGLRQMDIAVEHCARLRKISIYSGQTIPRVCSAIVEKELERIGQL